MDALRAAGHGEPGLAPEAPPREATEVPWQWRVTRCEGAGGGPKKVVIFGPAVCHQRVPSVLVAKLPDTKITWHRSGLAATGLLGRLLAALRRGAQLVDVDSGQGNSRMTDPN